MIQFFRKIRHQLLTESKLGKYLIYALGEIVLVVIGILIALGINNIQQNKILRQKEELYLKGLQTEFETSRLKLINLMTVNEQNYEGAARLLEYTAGTNESPTEKVFSELLLQSFSFDINYNPSSSLLDEMINSGSLKDISNDELRVRLTNWASMLQDISKQEEELGTQRRHVLNMFLTENYSIRTLFDQTNNNSEFRLSKKQNQRSNLNLLTSTKFENNVLLFLLESHSMETSHYDPLLKELDTILGLIGKELK